MRVTGLTRVSAGGGVDDEAITVQCVKVSEVDDFVAAQQARGLQVDARIFAALHLLSRERR